MKFYKKEYNCSGKWAYGYHRGLWRTIEAARLRMSRFSQALKFSDSICEEIFEQRKVSNIVLLNVTNFSKKQKHFYEKKINPICFWKSEVLTLDNRQKSIDYVSDFIIENFNGFRGGVWIRQPRHNCAQINKEIKRKNSKFPWNNTCIRIVKSFGTRFLSKPSGWIQLWRGCRILAQPITGRFFTEFNKTFWVLI